MELLYFSGSGRSVEMPYISGSGFVELDPDPWNFLILVDPDPWNYLLSVDPNPWNCLTLVDPDLWILILLDPDP